MRLPVMAALAALVVGCAPARQEVARDLVRTHDSDRPAARAEIAEGESAAFLQRAVAVLQAEGLRIAARTETQVVTAAREVEARCGVRACRARELAMVNVSGRVVRLELLRAVRSGSGGPWQLGSDRDAELEVSAREARLLQAMLGRAAPHVELSLR